MKILIVEDDKNSAKIMAHFLSQYGTCQIVSDGLEAMATVMEAYRVSEPYDLLFIDIMMPNLNGIDTLKGIRDFELQQNIEKGNRVKAIMTSALSGDVIRIEAYEQGCTAYLNKPINFQHLERILKDEFMI